MFLSRFFLFINLFVCELYCFPGELGDEPIDVDVKSYKESVSDLGELGWELGADFPGADKTWLNWI